MKLFAEIFDSSCLWPRGDESRYEVLAVNEDIVSFMNVREARANE
jgi:hypothetical protein